MSVTCQKDITVNVKSASLPDWYWTFEEAGLVDRVDKVHATHLVPTVVMDGGTGWLDAAPGIQGNAALYYMLGVPGTGAQIPQMNVATTDHSAAYTGNGFSLAGWFYIFSDANQFQGNSWELDILDNTDTFLGDVSVSFHNNQVQGHFGDAFSNDSIITAIPSFDAWHFLHLWFDAADTKFHMSIDNGATLNGTVAMVIPAGPGGGIQIFNFNSQYHCMQDEWAIKITGKFSAAQQAYLFNGGAGRTWPINLP